MNATAHVPKVRPAIGWPQWRFALLAGVGGGACFILSGALFSMANYFVNNLVSSFVMSMTISLVLVVSVDWARRVESPTWRKWAFAAAGTGTGIAASIATYPLVGTLVLGIPLDETLKVAWVYAPPSLIMSTLGAFGYMHWFDAGQRSEALHQLKIEHARSAREAYEARLAALQARIEPEFLSETLACIETLYDSEPPRAAKMLDDLIVHLRAALPEVEDTSSSLAVEMTLVESWLAIMRARSGGRLATAVARNDAPGDARMPPMVLLPIVQHGVASAQADDAGVVVNAACDGRRVVVTVDGTAAAFATSPLAAAMAQARTRLDALYGDAVRLSLQPSVAGRSQAVLEIPYERTDRRPR